MTVFVALPSFLLLIFTMLGVEPWLPHMQDKHSTELHPTSLTCYFEAGSY